MRHGQSDALVLLLQAARDGLRLPLIVDQLIAGAHRVLESDAHLAVLASVFAVSVARGGLARRVLPPRALHGLLLRAVGGRVWVGGGVELALGHCVRFGGHCDARGAAGCRVVWCWDAEGPEEAWLSSCRPRALIGPGGHEATTILLRSTVTCSPPARGLSPDQGKRVYSLQHARLLPRPIHPLLTPPPRPASITLPFVHTAPKLGQAGRVLRIRRSSRQPQARYLVNR